MEKSTGGRGGARLKPIRLLSEVCGCVNIKMKRNLRLIYSDYMVKTGKIVFFRQIQTKLYEPISFRLTGRRSFCEEGVKYV